MHKNIIFISDLHLGSGEANDFHHAYHLHKLLEYAEENADELVILGDFLELLQCNFYEIYAQHHLIFTHLFELAKKIPVKFVVGNHDAITAADFDFEKKSYFLGSNIEIMLEYENLPLKIFAAHGHQYSLMNSHQNRLDFSEVSAGDRIARAVGWMEKNIHPKIDNLLEAVYIRLKKLHRKISGKTKKFAEIVTPAHPDYKSLGGDFSEYIRAAKNILNSPRYSLCIFGHTHMPRVEGFENGIYANSGSWVGERTPIFLEANENFLRSIDVKTFEILENHSRQRQKVQQSERVNIFKNKVLA